MFLLGTCYGHFLFAIPLRQQLSLLPLDYYSCIYLFIWHLTTSVFFKKLWLSSYDSLIRVVFCLCVLFCVMQEDLRPRLEQSALRAGWPRLFRRRNRRSGRKQQVDGRACARVRFRSGTAGQSVNVINSHEILMFVKNQINNNNNIKKKILKYYI